MDDMAIREIQEALRALSFIDPRIPPIAVDGVYSPQTKQAVLIFQTLYELRPSGEVDRDTWEQLRFLYQEIKAVEPLMLMAFPHPQFVLRPNEQHELASFIQLMLQSISSVFSNIQEVPITGIYDRATEEAIRRIQQAHRLEANGLVNVETWNVLARMYNNRSDSIKR